MSLFRREVLEHHTARHRLHGEVILAQPLSISFMVAALVVLVGIAILWVALGTYARTETAPGILVTDKPSPKIIAPTPGLVTKLLVHEGSIVRKGDRLAVIGVDRKPQFGEGVASEGLSAVEARLEIGNEQVGLADQRAVKEGDRLRSVASAAESEAASLTQQIQLQREIVASNRSMFEKLAEVIARGFVSKVEFERRRQTLLNSEQTLRRLEQERTARAADAGQARAQLASLAIEVQREKTEIRSSIQALTQQRAQLRGEQAYDVVAPISGRVTALQTGEGRMATATVPLMMIVPQASVLKAEIYAPSRAIGLVHPGQETRLLYDAFPYARFGSFQGTIAAVSRTAIDPRESDVPIRLEEPVYRVTVKLAKQNVHAFGEQFALQPGMTLQANMVLERQTFLAWLLNPFNAVSKRSAQ